MDLQCVVCSKQIAENPLQCVHGDLYCSTCPNDCYRNGIKPPAIVLNLIVACTVKCEWTGPLKSLASHEKECPHLIEKCLLCNESYLLRARENHVGICKFRCTYCKAKIYPIWMDNHQKYCTLNPNRIIVCVCKANVSALEYEEHLKTDIDIHLKAFQSALSSLSSYSFTYDVILTKFTSTKKSLLFLFAGIEWYLFINNEKRLALCAYNTTDKFTLERRVLFSITIDNGASWCSSQETFRNDGTLLIDQEWKQKGVGGKLLDTIFDDAKHTFVCTIQVIY